MTLFEFGFHATLVKFKRFFVKNARMNVIIDLTACFMSNGRLISITAIQIQYWRQAFDLMVSWSFLREPSNIVLLSHFYALCHLEQL